MKRSDKYWLVFTEEKWKTLKRKFPEFARFSMQEVRNAKQGDGYLGESMGVDCYVYKDLPEYNP